MKFEKFEAGPGDNGRRADRVLRRFLPAASLSSVYSSIRKGLIRVNDKKIGADSRVFQGDILSVASFLLETQNTAAENVHAGYKFPYEIIFKNEHFLVLNKPYDIAVQGKNSIADDVAVYYASVKKNIPASLSFAPGPLHRLDRKTTGVLFFSWSLEGAQWFSDVIASHELGKKYIALVQGQLSSVYEWEDFIEKGADGSSAFHTVRVVKTPEQGGKRAYTKVEPLEGGIYNDIPVTLVKVTIQTGRMHQIRAQSSFHGFPLLGDTAYGGTAVHENQDFFLHSYEVCVPDNLLGLPASVKAGISTNFKKMLNKLLINWRNSFIL
jgi:23S rRNA pseudouridine955/2504/2580 synthase